MSHKVRPRRRLVVGLVLTLLAAVPSGTPVLGAKEGPRPAPARLPAYRP